MWAGRLGLGGLRAAPLLELLVLGELFEVCDTDTIGMRTPELTASFCDLAVAAPWAGDAACLGEVGQAPPDAVH